jgi:hypothetical protein
METLCALSLSLCQCRADVLATVWQKPEDRDSRELLLLRDDKVDSELGPYYIIASSLYDIEVHMLSFEPLQAVYVMTASCAIMFCDCMQPYCCSTLRTQTLL